MPFPPSMCLTHYTPQILLARPFLHSKPLGEETPNLARPALSGKTLHLPQCGTFALGAAAQTELKLWEPAWPTSATHSEPGRRRKLRTLWPPSPSFRSPPGCREQCGFHAQVPLGPTCSQDRVSIWNQFIHLEGPKARNGVGGRMLKIWHIFSAAWPLKQIKSSS